MDQLEALGAERFDIGVKRTDGTMILREGWGAKQLLKSLLWLRRENLNRGHIYVRPSGAHELNLVDDLKAGAITRMKAEGFEPAFGQHLRRTGARCLIEHPAMLEPGLKVPRRSLHHRRFGGDLGADWRHFGRLAGFTNPKPNRRLESEDAAVRAAG